MTMTEREKQIHNLKYIISMLEDESYSREEVISELKKELLRLGLHSKKWDELNEVERQSLYWRFCRQVVSIGRGTSRDALPIWSYEEWCRASEERGHPVCLKGFPV